MGFTAVWITPIVDNPDEAFTGGHPRLATALSRTAARPAITATGASTSTESTSTCRVRGPRISPTSPRRMRDEHGLKVVLDIVCNHGSPSYTMPVDQPMFGEIYDARRPLRRRPPEPAAGQARPGESAARLFTAANRTSRNCRTSTTDPDVWTTSSAPTAVDRPGRERFPDRHHPSRCRIRSGASSPSASARGVPGSSCSAKRFDYDAAQDRRAHPAGERRRQRARLPAERGDGRSVREARRSLRRLLEAPAPRRWRRIAIRTS